MDWSLLDSLEKATKVLTFAIGGAWVYLNAIRGRTFIPRLQPMISGSIVKNGTSQFILVDMQVKNVGSSIACIKEKGTALKISSLRALGAANGPMDLNLEDESAFAVFGLADDELIKIEPGTVIYAQEIIEVPKNKYEAFRLELRISALRGTFGKINRKWRAFSIIVDATAQSASERAEE